MLSPALESRVVLMQRLRLYHVARPERPPGCLPEAIWQKQNRAQVLHAPKPALPTTAVFWS
jgi:hypothetical protein